MDADGGTGKHRGEGEQRGLPARGIVNVRGDDGYCEVYVDGAFVGNAPAHLLLNEGTHVLELKRPGYEVYRREVLVLAGAEVSFWGGLEPEG